MSTTTIPDTDGTVLTLDEAVVRRLYEDHYVYLESRVRLVVEWRPRGESAHRHRPGPRRV